MSSSRLVCWPPRAEVEMAHAKKRRWRRPKHARHVIPRASPCPKPPIGIAAESRENAVARGGLGIRAHRLSRGRADGVGPVLENPGCGRHRQCWMPPPFVNARRRRFRRGASGHRGGPGEMMPVTRAKNNSPGSPHSTVTLFARLRGLSTSVPLITAVVIGEELHGDGIEDRRHEGIDDGAARRRSGAMSPSLSMPALSERKITLPPRATTSCSVGRGLLEQLVAAARSR